MSATQRAVKRPVRRRELRPWCDRAGRFSWLKALTLLGIVAPACVLSWQWATGDLGGRPVTEVIHGTGLWTIRWLLISLAITPTSILFKLPKLILVRRMLGVAAMAYVLSHLTLYSLDEQWQMLTVVSEIIHRFYLTIGFIALLGLVTLGITSTDGWIRRLRRNWQRLHRIAYGIAVLGIIHYILQTRADVSEAMMVGGFLVWLLLWRILPTRLRRNPLVLVAMAVVTSLATMGMELIWYGLFTGIRISRILAADQTIDYGLRPGHWVAVVGLGVAAAVIGQRGVEWARRRRQRQQGQGSALDPIKAEP